MQKTLMQRSTLKPGKQSCYSMINATECSSRYMKQNNFQYCKKYRREVFKQCQFLVNIIRNVFMTYKDKTNL